MEEGGIDRLKKDMLKPNGQGHIAKPSVGTKTIPYLILLLLC